MPIEIVLCDTAGDLADFVQFPFELYRDNPYWVPPLKKQELMALRQATNPALKNCKIKYWIARQQGKVLGRVSAFINELQNERTGHWLCRLTRIEFIDNKEVSKLLFDTAECWAKQQGMKEIHGPLGFTNLDHQGVLIEGFEHLPSIASEYHLSYYREHFEAAGYEKEMDWVEFRLQLEKEIPEKA